MDSNSGYKDRALSSLEGNWGKAVVAMIIYLFIIYLGHGSTLMIFGLNSGSGTVMTYLWSFLCLPLGWGLSVFFLNIARGNGPGFGQLFDGYRDFLRIIITYLLYVIIVGVGFVMLIVPGIILMLTFSQMGFILKDEPEAGPADVLRKSSDMMEGHKMDLFLLGLSFIGWGLLAILTFGLGFLLLYPYIYTAFAHFYEDLKKEQ